jgi:hypothetical protein
MTHKAVWRPGTATLGTNAEAPQNGALKNASINRLACLVRRWTWADGQGSASNGNWRTGGNTTETL